MTIGRSCTNHHLLWWLLSLLLTCIVCLLQQQPFQYFVLPVHGFSVIVHTASTRQHQRQILPLCRRASDKLTALKLPVAVLFSGKTTTIEICQNKHCCKNWKGKLSLPEIVSDLLSVSLDSTSYSDAVNSVEVVTVSCLSQCEKGPNMKLNVQADVNQLVFGIVDVTTASIVLESLLSSSTTVDDINHEDSNSFTIPSKLVAGINCIEKSFQVSNVDEKIRYLSSVIRALMNDDTLKYTSTNARALVLRGELYMEQCFMKRNVQSQEQQEMIQLALQDINDALIILHYQTDTNSDTKRNTIVLLRNNNELFCSLYGQAYRIQSEIYVYQQQYNNALESLTNASIVNPLMKSKYTTEMNRIAVQLQ